MPELIARRSDMEWWVECSRRMSSTARSAHDEFNGMQKVSCLNPRMNVGNNGPRRPVAAWAVALTLCAYSGSSAAGADGSAHASDWNGDARSAMRLIAGSGGRSPDAFPRSGIEIRLKPGWHTYWRYPGDA